MAFTRRPDDNAGWTHQREDDHADYLTKRVDFESQTAIVAIAYSNADRLYLVSATTGSTSTVTFASATRNSGVQNIIFNRAAGNTVVVTNGGTLNGSATQSAAKSVTIWRSDGAVWHRLFSSEAAQDVVNAGSLSVSGAAVFSGGVTAKSSLSISGSVAFGTQPNFPNGAVTSITSGAYITYAGNRFYEMSPGAGTVQIIIPDASTVRGARYSFKIKDGSTGQLIISPAVGKIEPQSATGSSTVTMSGAYDYATLIAGQTDWWIIG